MMKNIGIATALLAFLGAQFWGVPYYIRYEVAQEVKALNDVEVTPAEITTLTAQMESVEGSITRLDGTIVRVEGKIDTLSGLFIADLNRRAAQ